MARLHIIVEDGNGQQMTGADGRVYELGKDLGSLRDIEGGSYGLAFSLNGLIP